MTSLKQAWLCAWCDCEVPLMCRHILSGGCLSKTPSLNPLSSELCMTHGAAAHCALRTALCFDCVAAGPISYNRLRPEILLCPCLFSSHNYRHVQISSRATLRLKIPDLRTKCCWSPRMASRMRRSYASGM